MTFPLRQKCSAAFPRITLSDVMGFLCSSGYFIMPTPYNLNSLSCNLKCPWWCFQLASSIKSYSILLAIIIFLNPYFIACFINTCRVSAWARCWEHRPRASLATSPSPCRRHSGQNQYVICEVASWNNFDKYLYSGHEIDISIRVFMHRLLLQIRTERRSGYTVQAWALLPYVWHHCGTCQGSCTCCSLLRTMMTWNSTYSTSYSRLHNLQQ